MHSSSMRSSSMVVAQWVDCIQGMEEVTVEARIMDIITIIDMVREVEAGAVGLMTMVAIKDT